MLRSALILIVGFLAVVFDTTIVSVALHTLATQLHASVSTIQWVTTGYLLALGIAVPLSTWGLRRFGGKRLWMAALAVFLIGSVGSSLAWDVGSLIAWRVVQGVGGGIMLPLMTTLIMGARPIAVPLLIVAAATVPFAWRARRRTPRCSRCVRRPLRPRRGDHAGDRVAFLGLDKQQIAHSSVLTRTLRQLGGSSARRC